MSLKNLTTWISELVATVHKEAALVLGVLTAMGVTPVAPSQEKWSSSLMIGYSALVTGAEKLGLKLKA